MKNKKEKNILVTKQKLILPLDSKYFNKKYSRDILKNPWELNNFLFSKGVSFHPTEKKLMSIAFRLWFKDIQKKFKKRDFVELLIFIRKEKK